MLTDDSIIFTHSGVDGVALAWVIAGNCLYDLPLSVEYADIFLNANNVVDVSGEFPDHAGITVELKQDGVLLETFQTSEYFGNILLSNPTVLNLKDYQPSARGLRSPYATFDGERFTLTHLIV